ncbi:MAG: hypothetical protein AB8C46_00220 [Burkholderiaceae bacterium]
MQFNTWGIGRRDEIVSTFEPDRFPFIERVKSHLDLEIIEIKGNGEPVQIALGERTNPGDPEAAQPRVTPFFSSFDALDFFCRLNLQHYLAFDPADGLPRRWFWEESQRRRQTASARPLAKDVKASPGADMDVPTVPTAGQDDPSANTNAD